MGVLNREAERLGIPVLDNPTVDTMELASRRLPDAPSLSLQQIMSVLGIADREEHRALSDARQTFECLRRLSDMPGPRHESMPPKNADGCAAALVDCFPYAAVAVG